MQLRATLLIGLCASNFLAYGGITSHDKPLKDSSLPSVNPLALSQSTGNGSVSIGYTYSPEGNVQIGLPTPFLSLQYDLGQAAMHPYGLPNGWRVLGQAMIDFSADGISDAYDNELYTSSGQGYSFKQADVPSGSDYIEIPLVDNELKTTQFYKLDGQHKLSEFVNRPSDVIGSDASVGYILVEGQNKLFHINDNTDMGDPSAVSSLSDMVLNYFDTHGNLLAVSGNKNVVSFMQTGPHFNGSSEDVKVGDVLFASEDQMGQIRGIICTKADNSHYVLAIGFLKRDSSGNLSLYDDAKRYEIVGDLSFQDSTNVSQISTPMHSLSGQRDTYVLNYKPYTEFENLGQSIPGQQYYPWSITSPLGTVSQVASRDINSSGYQLPSYQQKNRYVELRDDSEQEAVNMPGIGLSQSMVSGIAVSNTYGGYIDHPSNAVSPSWDAAVGSGAATVLGKPEVDSLSGQAFLSSENPALPLEPWMYQKSLEKYQGSNKDFAYIRQANVSPDSSRSSVLGQYSDSVMNHLGLSVESYSHYVNTQGATAVDQPLSRSLIQYAGASKQTDGSGQFTDFATYDDLNKTTYNLPVAQYSMLYSEDGTSHKTSLSTTKYLGDAYGTPVSSTQYKNAAEYSFTIPTDGSSNISYQVPSADSSSTWQVSPDSTQDLSQIANNNKGFIALSSMNIHYDACTDGSDNLCTQSITADDSPSTKIQQLFQETEINAQGQLVASDAGYMQGDDYHPVTEERYQYWNDLDGSNPLSINGHQPLLLKAKVSKLLDTDTDKATSDKLMKQLDDALPQGKTQQETDYYYTYQSAQSSSPYDLTDATDTQGKSVIPDPDQGVLVITTANPADDKDNSAIVTRQYVSYGTGQTFMDENSHIEHNLDHTGQGNTQALIDHTTYTYDDAGRTLEAYDHLSQTAVQNSYGDHSQGAYSDLSTSYNVVSNHGTNTLVFTGAKQSDYNAQGQLSDVYDSQTVDQNNIPTHQLYHYVYESPSNQPSTGEDEFNAQNKLIAKIGYGYANDENNENIENTENNKNASGQLSNQAVVSETYHYDRYGKVDITRTFKGSPAVGDYYNDSAPSFLGDSKDLSDPVFQRVMSSSTKVEGRALSYQNSNISWLNDLGQPVASLSLPLSSNGEDVKDPVSVPGSSLTLIKHDYLGDVLEQDAYLNISEVAAAKYHLMSKQTVEMGPLNNAVMQTASNYTEDNSNEVSLSTHAYSTGADGLSYSIVRNNQLNTDDQYHYATGDITQQDDLGRVTKVFKPYLLTGDNPNSGQQPDIFTSYQYDDNNTLISSKDFGGNTTTNSYNADGSLAKTLGSSAFLVVQN